MDGNSAKAEFFAAHRNGFTMRTSSSHKKDAVPLPRSGSVAGEARSAATSQPPDELRAQEAELKLQNEHLRLVREELEATQRRLVELYDFAPIGYVTLNDAGLIQAANLTSSQMLGIERSRLLTRHFSRFVFGEDQDAFHRCWRRVFAFNEKQVCEVRLCPLNGEVFFARLDAVQAVENGRTVCRMAVTNITEQKKAEEAIRESENSRLRYESDEWKRIALEAGGLGAWDQDCQTGRIACSVRACAMLGLPADASITWQDVVARVHPEDRVSLLDEIARSSDANGARRCDAVFRVSSRDGSTRWLRLMASTYLDVGPDPRPLRRTGVLSDLTHQKETEEWLKSRAEQLDRIVHERTAKLQEAVSELEHFSYTLAHDLRAPLRAIEGYGSLLLEECQQLTDRHRMFIERSNSAAQRMDALITDALNYNKIAIGDFDLEPVECEPFLRELIYSYPQFQHARENISIDGPMPVILGSPALLTQCFSNLLTNALKFVAPGNTPRVRISAEEKEGRARLWFADNGIGIDEDGMRRIFHMFQRLSQNYEGTGVGLALVKKAAERMRGSVGVESVPGQGSRFWIELQTASKS